MPSGFAHACPHLVDYQTPRKSGSLVGTSIVVFFNIALLMVTFLTSSCRIPKLSAYVFFAVYTMFVIYQVGGVYEAWPALCFGDICL